MAFLKLPATLATTTSRCHGIVPTSPEKREGVPSVGLVLLPGVSAVVVPTGELKEHQKGVVEQGSTFKLIDPRGSQSRHRRGPQAALSDLGKDKSPVFDEESVTGEPKIVFAY